MSTEILRILLERLLVVRDGVVVLALGLGHLGEGALQRGAVGQLVLRLVQDSLRLLHAALRREHLRELSVRDDGVRVLRIREVDRLLVEALGERAVAALLFCEGEPQRHAHVLRERLQARGELPLCVGVSLERDLGARRPDEGVVVGRVLDEGLVEAGRGLRVATVCVEQLALPHERKHVALIDLERLVECLARLACMILRDHDPAALCERLRALLRAGVDLGAAVDDEREIAERVLGRVIALPGDPTAERQRACMRGLLREGLFGRLLRVVHVADEEMRARDAVERARRSALLVRPRECCERRLAVIGDELQLALRLRDLLGDRIGGVMACRLLEVAPRLRQVARDELLRALRREEVRDVGRGGDVRDESLRAARARGVGAKASLHGELDERGVRGQRARARELREGVRAVVRGGLRGLVAVRRELPPRAHTRLDGGRLVLAGVRGVLEEVVPEDAERREAEADADEEAHADDPADNLRPHPACPSLTERPEALGSRLGVRLDPLVVQARAGDRRRRSNHHAGTVATAEVDLAEGHSTSPAAVRRAGRERRLARLEIAEAHERTTAAAGRRGEIVIEQSGDAGQRVLGHRQRALRHRQRALRHRQRALRHRQAAGGHRQRVLRHRQ